MVLSFNRTQEAHERGIEVYFSGRGDRGGHSQELVDPEIKKNHGVQIRFELCRGAEHELGMLAFGHDGQELGIEEEGRLRRKGPGPVHSAVQNAFTGEKGGAPLPRHRGAYHCGKPSVVLTVELRKPMQSLRPGGVDAPQKKCEYGDSGAGDHRECPPRSRRAGVDGPPRTRTRHEEYEQP